jgi:hypothetical protein
LMPVGTPFPGLTVLVAAMTGRHERGIGFRLRGFERSAPARPSGDRIVGAVVYEYAGTGHFSDLERVVAAVAALRVQDIRRLWSRHRGDASSSSIEKNVCVSDDYLSG